MSDNLLSEQLSLPNGQMGQREPVASKVDSTALSVSIGMLGTVTTNLPSDQLVEHLSNNLSPHQSSQNSLLPSKRKASAEHLANNLSSHQPSSVPNKRVQIQSRPSAPNRKTMQIQTTPGTNGSVNKRMVRNDSISKSGSQRVQTPKNKTQPMEPSPKAKTESSEAVRSKMQESLAAALAMVTQGQDNSNKPLNEESDSSHGVPNEKESSSANESKPVEQESQLTSIIPDGDASFTDGLFVKDELLQGNGLSWAWDMDMVAAEAKEIKSHEKESGGGVIEKKEVASPHDLATKIENELFKLYGGVNKKYKEKGRSLMFNLKDRNNPELRERVMSGDIAPERLCSMTAEELASKELSEWRVAKAQELASMIVLPDSGIDPRRLVKKTHKGEYQVCEVEQDDDVSVEVSVGTSFTQVRAKNKETEVKQAKEKSTEDRLTIPADGADLMQGLIVDELKDTEFLPPIVSLDEFMESLDSEPPFENIAAEAGKAASLSKDEGGSHSSHLKDADEDKLGIAEKREVKVKESEVKPKFSASLVERKLSPKSSPPAGRSKAECVWEGVLQLNISAHVNVMGFFRSGEKTSTTGWPTSLEIKGRVRLDAFDKFLEELPMSRSRAVMIAHFVLKDSSTEFDRLNFKEVVDSYISDERLGFAEPAPGNEVYFCPNDPKILELLTKRLLKNQSEILNSTDDGLIGIVVWRRPHFSSVVSTNSSSQHHKHTSKKQQHNLTTPRNMNVNTNLITTSPTPHSQRFVNPHPVEGDDDDVDIPPGFGPGSTRDEDDLPEFNFSGNISSSGPKFPTENSSHGSRITHLQPPQSASKPVNQMRELIQRYGQTGTGSLPENGVGAVGIKRWNDDDDDDIPEWDPSAHRKLPSLQPPLRQGFNQPIQQHMVNQVPVHPLVQPGPPILPVQNPAVNMVYPQNVAQSWGQGGRWVQPPGAHGHQVQGSLGNQPGAGQQYGLPVLRAGRPGTDRGAPRSKGY